MNREILADAPSGAFWRVAYELAADDHKRTVFQSVVHDRDLLRKWFRDTYGFEAPFFVVTTIEAEAKEIATDELPAVSSPAGHSDEHFESLIRHALQAGTCRVIPFRERPAQVATTG